MSYEDGAARPRRGRRCRGRWRRFAACCRRDPACGRGRTRLPDAPARKRPGAAARFARRYPFPARLTSTDRWDDTVRRRHLGPNVLQKAVRAAVAGAGIERPAICRALRRCFAVRLLEAGADIRTMQAPLGHKGPATTQVHTHVLQGGACGVLSSLER